MKRIVTAIGLLALALPAFAQRVIDKDGRALQLFPHKDHPMFQAGPQAGGSNLINHGGPIIVNAKVVSIFWGSAWGSNSAPSALAQTITGFFAQFGGTSEYNTIHQYGVGFPSSLTNQYWVVSTNPPHIAVTDADIQGQVIAYINGHGFDNTTIYEVFLPNGYYSTSGGASSCGGPNLQYCAYHGNFGYNGHDVKYSSMPYPSCGGCQWTGWTTAQNFEHFGTHETREAATDPDLNAWYDHRGFEADDKCAWSPAPFLDGPWGYQWEWSNADRGCVKTK